MGHTLACLSQSLSQFLEQFSRQKEPGMKTLRLNSARQSAARPFRLGCPPGRPHSWRPSQVSPVPIWLAVLFATACEARRNGEIHAVRWDWVAGRALDTNAGRDTEHIERLGVSLMGGHTMAVCWMPGDSTYTVDVYRQTELCA